MSLISDLIFGGLKGILEPITTMFTKKQDANIEKFKVDGQVDMAAFNAHVSLLQTMNKIRQDHWIIALQWVFAMPLAIYFGKCILYDKVLALGTTDPLRGDIQIWAGMIMVYLFGTNLLQKWRQ